MNEIPVLLFHIPFNDINGRMHIISIFFTHCMAVHYQSSIYFFYSCRSFDYDDAQNGDEGLN